MPDMPESESSQSYVPAPKPVTRDEVFATCNRLSTEGQRVSHRGVRVALGNRGSLGTIGPLVEEWKKSMNVTGDDDESISPQVSVDAAKSEPGGEGGDSRTQEYVQESRLVISVREDDARRQAIVTQANEQAARFYGEMIKLERNAAINEIRLEERELATKAIQQAKLSVQQEAAAEIEAAVQRERTHQQELLLQERKRQEERLIQEQRVASARRQVWVLVSAAVGILVGGGVVFGLVRPHGPEPVLPVLPVVPPGTVVVPSLPATDVIHPVPAAQPSATSTHDGGEQQP